MFDEELNKIINDSKNIVTIKVYNKLIRMEELKGGIISSKKFIADELNISSQSVANAIKWLKGSGYVTETKFQGQTQFILNHILSEKSPPKPTEKDEQKENTQPKSTIVKKGGKTITRFEIPD